MAAIKAHGNLTKGLMSVSIDGGKIEYLAAVEVRMTGCEFKVQPGAHRRCVENYREISAKIWGDAYTVRPVTAEEAADVAGWVEVTYNPKTHPERVHFYTRDGVRVDRASVVRFITHPSLSNVTKCRAYIRAEEV